jgi:hypothetical protein
LQGRHRLLLDSSFGNEPCKHVCGVGIGRKDWIEDVLDPAVPNHQSQTLEERAPSDNVSRKVESVRQVEIVIAQ